ncbi:pollen-specific protein C13-like [Vitis riparia]|uniref:pollen-specific protein C13-like n=1 Tax=Vitis riparia TaxID=96939 RepID=UPI00155A29BE|nr:pollen-specific protein C13-like [Vitis riparia]
MAKLLMSIALCLLLVCVSEARPMRKPFVLHGRVYCDTCRAGFETSATTYIAGARVRIECKDRNSLQLVYSVEGVTDSTGTYKISIADDHGDQMCDAVLVKSPQPDCAKVDPGRDRSRLSLTRSNGLVSDTRFANAMGFMKDEPASGCTQLLKQYQESDD